MCVRGGFGTLRILQHLDYEAAIKHPKLLISFSDGTALQLALLHKASWKSLSGPLVVEWAKLEPGMREFFLAMARGTIPDPFPGPSGEELTPVRPGQGSGALIGGNLSTIVRLIGSDYLPDLSDSILFIEEVGELPYRIDALFAQLRLSGILDRLGGLLLGQFTEWRSTRTRATLTPDQIFDDYLSHVPYPVAKGLLYGHFLRRVTMPVGLRAQLVVTQEQAQLRIVESLPNYRASNPR